jgi:predicted nucleic acid-binding protein
MNFSFDPTNVVATVVAVLAVLVPLLKKLWPVVGAAVEKAGPAIETGVEDAVQLVSHLAQSPLFAGKVEVGKLEAQHVIDHLNSTTAISEAKTILLGVGKVYNELAPDEKVKAEVLLRLALSALGIQLNDAEVQGVFTEAQKAIDALRGQPFYKAAFETQPVATTA